jgi:hypothetical protein
VELDEFVEMDFAPRHRVEHAADGKRLAGDGVVVLREVLVDRRRMTREGSAAEEILEELLHLVGVGRHGLQMLEGPRRLRLGAVQADHAAEVVAPDALEQPRLIQTPVPGRGWLGEEQQQDVGFRKPVADPLVPVVPGHNLLRDEALHASAAQLRQDALDGPWLPSRIRACG